MLLEPGRGSALLPVVLLDQVEDRQRLEGCPAGRKVHAVTGKERDGVAQHQLYVLSREAPGGLVVAAVDEAFQGRFEAGLGLQDGPERIGVALVVQELEVAQTVFEEALEMVGQLGEGGGVQEVALGIV
ncbi:hypothetical protein D3C84_864750 [compost metagenome]